MGHPSLSSLSGRVKYGTLDGPLFWDGSGGPNGLGTVLRRLEPRGRANDSTMRP